jgi:hypothetical protein
MRARVRGVVDGVGAASTASDAPATIDAEALLAVNFYHRGEVRP